MLIAGKSSKCLFEGVKKFVYKFIRYELFFSIFSHFAKDPKLTIVIYLSEVQFSKQTYLEVFSVKFAPTALPECVTDSCAVGIDVN